MLRAFMLAFSWFKELTGIISKETTCKAVVLRKHDGFHIKGYGNGVYRTKNDKPMTGHVLSAIERFLLAWKAEDDDGDYFIDPRHVKLSSRKHAKVICFEFVCTTPDGKEALMDLLLGRCIDSSTKSLDTVNYKYGVRIFDAMLGKDLRYDYVYHAIMEAYGPDHTAERIWCDEELKSTLNTAEGIVIHEWDRKKRCDHAVKIKAPLPVKLYIIGVKCTIPEFEGWDRILYCTEDYTVIHESNFTEIFTDYTRVAKGKVFVNMHSVKADSNGVVHCTSSSVLEPILDALFVEISKTLKLEPIASTPTEAQIRTDTGVKTVRCGKNRSFKLDPDVLYLRTPIPVVLGANDIWRMPEIHLQATSILAVGDYNPENLLMPMTSEELLRTVPTRDRITAYEMLGVGRGPFHGMAKLGVHFFAPDY
jgi:hypothetical protein